MRSNFDEKLRVEDGVVSACGELVWGPGETEAHVTVTISQKGEKLVGSAASPPNFEPQEKEWMLSVRPSDANRKFKKGAAHAVGVVHTIHGADIDVFHWDQDIELDPDVVDET